MIISLKDIVKRYNEVIAIDNVSLEIKEGEIYGLLGPNGAGKTSTINAILGLIKIDSGEIRIFDTLIKGENLDIKRDIGFVPQDVTVFEDLTAYENVTFFGKLYGLRGDKLKAATKEALEFTGLWDKKKVFPSKFSGGMKRRLNIACAIVHQPKLIIMDEPTVGIDPQSRNHILNSVRELNKRGATIIYTSHYMEEIEAICSYISIMDNGRIIARGTKEELKELIASSDKVTVKVNPINHTLVEELKLIEGVTAVGLDENTLSITLSRGADCLQDIISTISATGSEVEYINFDKPTIEDVFLTLTGKNLRD